MDANRPEKEKEDANIKYEKLMNELEKLPEYQMQIQKAKQEKEVRFPPDLSPRPCVAVSLFRSLSLSLCVGGHTSPIS